jgi:endonuclease/exonuclease/phosphatase family metal-dependent hydrolase
MSAVFVVFSIVGLKFNFESIQVSRFIHPVFLSILLLLPLRAAAWQDGAPRRPVVRLATYNVHGGLEASPRVVGRFLAGLNLDLLSLQEVPDQDYLAMVAAETGLDYFTPTDRFKVVLARQPLEGVERIPLPTGRGVIRATAMLRGVPVSIYGIHNSWDQSGDRENRHIVNEILPADANPRKILLGDFNDEHYSTQNIILESALNDAWTDLGVRPGERTTWPATGFAGAEGHQLIDLLMYDPAGGMFPVDAHIPKLAPVLSDHRPVVFSMMLTEPIFVDPPQDFIVDAVFGSELLELRFDREVDPASAARPERYSIRRLGGAGPAVEVLRARVDRHRRRVRLRTSAHEPGETYELIVAGVVARGGETGMRATGRTYACLTNLLLNPGAEAGLTDWEVSGALEAVTGLTQLQAYSGDSFFAGGAADAASRATQSVSLQSFADPIDQGRVTLHLGAWLAAAYLIFPGGESRAEPYDEAEVSFTLHDAAGRELRAIASGKHDTLYWWPWREAVPAPPGTRSVRATIAANRRTLIGGTRNDGAVDEVFVGIELGSRGHGHLGGNLLLNPGAESGDLAGWNVEGGFRHGANLARFFTDYLVTRSGDGMFMAYPGGDADESTLSQTVALPGEARYLRWGGRLKSFASILGVGLRAEVLDSASRVIASADTGELHCAQWESFSGHLRLPADSRRARLTVSAGVRGRAAFADDLVLQALGSSDGAPWFERGDVDQSGRLNITDAVVILGFLFTAPAPAVFCADSADVDDDGRVAVTDAIRLLQHLYQGGPPPEEPSLGSPGPDPSPDELGCE